MWDHSRSCIQGDHIGHGLALAGQFPRRIWLGTMEKNDPGCWTLGRIRKKGRLLFFQRGVSPRRPPEHQLCLIKKTSRLSCRGCGAGLGSTNKRVATSNHIPCLKSSHKFHNRDVTFHGSSNRETTAAFVFVFPTTTVMCNY